MSKPTGIQLDAINLIKTELDYWATSNDIHSPSHGGSIDEQIGLFLMDFPEGDPIEDKMDDVAKALGRLHSAIAELSPCTIRTI